ncbi:uncharacterized protein BDCG_09458 [Blastomyces dermatitidis ER-3]|uniref:Uncharacterized protein n=1 Tax=Ajellomyces dermatitidis (strain ER-3 / ATCC MYA-2586) TaxID=559297 RepID=A0ABP2EUY7_AJEDR|nr:uncharacterized protein BDCG_09458 [Blastomyces dermatitidis ER-3]EEQ86189.2 hypothetical protein BDCG_09458 [Blastomyces dermatitidis ER-3]
MAVYIVLPTLDELARIVGNDPTPKDSVKAMKRPLGYSTTTSRRRTCRFPGHHALAHLKPTSYDDDDDDGAISTSLAQLESTA